MGRVTREVVANVVDFFIENLGNYKGRLLYFTLRAVLIKSVMEGILIHSMAIYKWPQSIIKEYDTKIKNLL